ncbi:hypothetical protein [Brevundimonas sp.]|uniref:hypothetical protein n=1 Tax=Brevundimonas sp. TaxID=1871086 RepID=UPI002D3DBA43|nr:hypothetical protein [Brevundimonas sp.]HYC66681.1 hypothetical protein [Brevundimonas sp.]
MTKAPANDEAAPVTGLALLRQPFPAHQISKLPKETKAQIDERKANRSAGVSCKVCGGWHHKNAVHLDYVGHAALTDRLLDVDPEWSWEPAALRDGLPAFDASGGLWIKLTVCGVSRLGYGHAAAKPQMDPGAREKEVIGDALRNAAMRFGAALDLWHKGDLHAAEEAEAEKPKEDVGSAAADFAIGTLRTCASLAELAEFWAKNAKGLKADLSAADFARVEKAKDDEKARLTPADDGFPGDIPMDEAA